MQSNSFGDTLTLILLLQLGGALVFALGGLYFLYCLGRAASGLDRMADVAEAWLLMQQHQMQQGAARVQTPANSQVAENEGTAIRPAVMEYRASETSDATPPTSLAPPKP